VAFRVVKFPTKLLPKLPLMIADRMLVSRWFIKPGAKYEYCAVDTPSIVLISETHHFVPSEWKYINMRMGTECSVQSNSKLVYVEFPGSLCGVSVAPCPVNFLPFAVVIEKSSAAKLTKPVCHDTGFDVGELVGFGVGVPIGPVTGEPITKCIAHPAAFVRVAVVFVFWTFRLRTIVPTITPMTKSKKNPVVMVRRDCFMLITTQ
jgi:hypothetical protein